MNIKQHNGEGFGEAGGIRDQQYLRGVELCREFWRTRRKWPNKQAKKKKNQEKMAQSYCVNLFILAGIKGTVPVIR